MNPYCLLSNILSVVFGALSLKILLLGNEPVALLAIFAILTIIAQLLYMMHRGIRPVAGPLSALSLVLSIFLLRYAIGGFPLVENHLPLVVGAIITAQIVKLPVG